MLVCVSPRIRYDVQIEALADEPPMTAAAHTDLYAVLATPRASVDDLIASVSSWRAAFPEPNREE